MALKDQSDLAADATFTARVRAAIIAAAVAIKNEAVTAVTIPLYQARARLAQAVLAAPDTYKTLFAAAVGADATVAAAAGSPATQANVSDLQITNAVSNTWNALASTV
jgi:hypothetical protein